MSNIIHLLEPTTFCGLLMRPEARRRGPRSLEYRGSIYWTSIEPECLPIITLKDCQWPAPRKP